MSRSNLLGRLHRLQRPEKAPELPSSLPEFPCYPDPVDQFRKEIERVSGVFLDARSPELLLGALGAVASREAPCEIYWESPDLFETHGIKVQYRDPEAFQRNHLVYSSHPIGTAQLPLLLDSKPFSRTALAAMPVSASSADWGVAETGTVVERAGEGRGRALAVVAPVHLSFVRERDLLMNHADLFDRITPGFLSSYQVLVTGPSRTADIEKTLVLGVHGPQRWYVLLTS